MNYELAKKLKDAGFPQRGKGSWIGGGIPSKELIKDTNGLIQKIVKERENHFYQPTLSEIIEACGDRFTNLRRVFNDFNNEWFAEYTPLLVAEKEGYGFTPEEAVANLWLELNRK